MANGPTDGISNKTNPAGRVDDISPGALSEFEAKVNDIYTITPKNWYKSLPYGFRFYDRKGKSTTFFLPINPNNINVTTHFATNIVTSLYGTIEEHSEVRYHDFIISGTTGMAPIYSKPPLFQNAGGIVSTAGRESFPVFRSVAQGFASRTEGALRQALGAVNDIVDFKGKKNKNGLDLENTGYFAFHNMFRYFMLYKKDVAGEADSSGRRAKTNQRSRHPLLFLNYKDGTQYNVAITRFDLTNDAADPMLYKYKIAMRGYELTSVDKGGFEPVDIGADLGLGEVASLSIFAAMKRLSRNAKNAAGAALAAGTSVGS